MKDEHPFEPYVGPNAKKLIIGTIPPHRFCVKNNKKLFNDDVDFYYGSKDNYFWELTGDIFGITFLCKNNEESIVQRKSFLEDNNIGITDIIDKCSRVNYGSSDKDLKEIEYKEISKLLIAHPKITELIYTSSFVKTCIYKTLNIYHEIDRDNKRIQYLSLDGKKYKVHILLSPSPNALRNLGKNGEVKRKQHYEKVFVG